MHTWDTKMRLKWKWTWKSMLDTWHLSATCLNYSYPVRPDALVSVLNFYTYITRRFQCLQIGCGCRSPYTHLFLLHVIISFFKWYKKGEPSKSFRCWNIKATVYPAYIVEQVLWIQLFNTLVQVLTVSPGQRHDLWGRTEWQWWFPHWYQKLVGRLFIYSLLTAC